VFKDGGSMSENAIISDIDTVLAAFGRDAYGNILVRLQSTDAFVTFKDALSRNPQLAVDVRWQRDHLKDQSKTITRVFNFLGWFVGSVMGLGAVFGGVTTMYAIVDARTREIATLRAIGFSSSAVVISVLVESTLLAVPGALLGYAAAWLVFNGRAVSTVGLSFPLAVTPGLAVWALALSLAIGLIGGLAPAIRVARMSVVTGLRAM
jgi:putative ABC transport system permease protein